MKFLLKTIFVIPLLSLYCSVALGSIPLLLTQKISFMTSHEFSSEFENNEKAAVKAAFRNIYSAMLEGNTDMMEKLLSENFQLTHMTGRAQTKKEWLADIDSDRMEYHSAKEHSVLVEFKDDTAVLAGRDIVDATIYGARGQWNLQLTTHFAKRNGKWIATRMDATTF